MDNGRQLKAHQPLVIPVRARRQRVAASQSSSGADVGIAMPLRPPAPQRPQLPAAYFLTTADGAAPKVLRAPARNRYADRLALAAMERRPDEHHRANFNVRRVGSAAAGFQHHFPNVITIVSISRQTKSKLVPVIEALKRFSEKWFSHVLLLVFLALYACAGAYIFITCEAATEKSEKKLIVEAKEKFMKDLWTIVTQQDAQTTILANQTLFNSSVALQFDTFERLLFRAYHQSGITSLDEQWTFWGALFYSMTVFTTIGYGHLTPTTFSGRLATMIYAIFGIPILLMVLADLGKVLTRIMKWTFKKVRGMPSCVRQIIRQLPNAPTHIKRRLVRLASSCCSCGSLAEESSNQDHETNNSNSYVNVNGEQQQPNEASEDTTCRVVVESTPPPIITMKRAPSEHRQLQADSKSATNNDHKKDDNHGQKNHQEGPKSLDKIGVNKENETLMNNDNIPGLHQNQDNIDNDDDHNDDDDDDTLDDEEDIVDEEDHLNPNHHRDDTCIPMGVPFALLVAYMMCGAFIFSVWENWNFFDSLYFVFISMSTIGFGDLVPSWQPRRMVGTFVYLLFGLALSSMCINVVQEKIQATFVKAKIQIGERMGLDLEQIMGDGSSGGQVFSGEPSAANSNDNDAADDSLAQMVPNQATRSASQNGSSHRAKSSGSLRSSHKHRLSTRQKPVLDKRPESPPPYFSPLVPPSAADDEGAAPMVNLAPSTASSHLSTCDTCKTTATADHSTAIASITAPTLEPVAAQIPTPPTPQPLPPQPPQSNEPTSSPQLQAQTQPQLQTKLQQLPQPQPQPQSQPPPSLLFVPSGVRSAGSSRRSSVSHELNELDSIIAALVSSKSSATDKFAPLLGIPAKARPSRVSLSTTTSVKSTASRQLSPHTQQHRRATSMMVRRRDADSRRRDGNESPTKFTLV